MSEEEAPLLLRRKGLRGARGERDLDPADVQAYTKSLATAFAEVWVAGEEDYASFLDESAVLAVGDAEYWSEW